MAGPSTAAMTGFGPATIRRSSIDERSMRRRLPISEVEPSCLRSAPEQKTSPAPVSTMARQDASCCSVSNASIRSSFMAGEKALRRDGLFRVTMATAALPG